MGRNSQRRRNARQRGSRYGGPPRTGTPFEQPPGWDREDAEATIHAHLIQTVARLVGTRPGKAQVHALAERLERLVAPCPRLLLEELTAERLCQVVDSVVEGGWGPADLAQLVRRCADEADLAHLAAALHERRHGRDAGWLRAVEAIDHARPLRFGSTGALAGALRLLALLTAAPRMQTGALAGASSVDDGSAEHPKLAQVRALLAKAESTDFPEEAEALSAKAQELVTKYALEQFAERSDPATGGSGAPLGFRRIWLDPPYLSAKAVLVHEVASANRCRSASAGELGFCVLIGTPVDLDVVDLLVTSLLVQAASAMLRQGSRTDRTGASRTRSFRRSFLLSYAIRVGERLRETDESTVAADRGGALVPVLREHTRRVDGAFHAAVPTETRRTGSVSNGEGWVAGRAAADLADLRAHGRLEERAG